MRYKLLGDAKHSRFGIFSKTLLVSKTPKERALALGCEPCPKCEDGWLQYLIATDEWNCPICHQCSPRPDGKPDVPRGT